jgi:hypothetical protein
MRLRSLPALALLLAGTLGVCPGQVFQTDSSTAAATVIQMVGNVWVQRDNQPSSQWALLMGAQVKPQQIIVTGPDGYAEFRLSDGSTFEVFPNSRVTFRNTPGDWKDLLEMLLGRVKVHIQKLNGQPNYNRVRTPTAIISVRGTVFDVVVDDPDETFVAVDEGQVQVQHRLQGGEPRLLNPGDSIRVLKNVPLAQRVIDRGSILHGALRAAADAIYTTLTRNPRTSGGGPPAGGGGGGGGLPGDHGDGNKKPPPPPSGGGTSNPPSDAGPGAPPPPN